MGCIRRPVMVEDQPWVDFARSAAEELPSDGGADGGDAAAPPACLACPPPVLRGAKSTMVSIDWLRLSVNRLMLNDVVAVMNKHYGDCGKACKGRFFLSAGKSWGSGGVFYDPAGVDDPADHVVVEVPAGMLDLLGAPYRLDLLRDLLAVSCTVTRLDVALDVEGSGISIIRDLSACCDRGELCGLKRHEYTASMVGTDVTGEIIRLGSRGKNGSGRYVRWYDKGLETQSKGRGEWVRGEAEFSDDVAHQVAMRLFDPGVSPGMFLASVVVGAFDVREVTGRRELRLRPVVKWWADFVASIGAVRFKAKRVRATLEGWTSWMRTCVVPQSKGYAAACGVSVDVLLLKVLGDVPAKLEAAESELGRSVVSCLRGDRWWVLRPS